MRLTKSHISVHKQYGQKALSIVYYSSPDFGGLLFTGGSMAQKVNSGISSGESLLQQLAEMIDGWLDTNGLQMRKEVTTYPGGIAVRLVAWESKLEEHLKEMIREFFVSLRDIIGLGIKASSLSNTGSGMYFNLVPIR